MISSSMKRMMRYTVSTKRRPAASSDGKQGVPVVHLASLKTTPIDPLNTDEFHNLILRYNIQEPLLHMRAGSEMYKRRAGWKYAETQMRLFRFMRGSGFIGNGQYIKSCVIRSGSALAPN